MKAISLWQPWASLWCSGHKIHETRSWPTFHRGWLLVHAAKRRIDDLDGSFLGDICNSVFGHHYGLDVPRGAIVGAVHLVECIPTDKMFVLGVPGDQQEDYECGNFAHGRFAWRADNFKQFVEPIPYRGAQGFFNVPDKLVPIPMVTK